MIKIYMLVENTKFSLPIDIGLSLQELSMRHSVPLQTLKNRLTDGKCIRYLNAYVICVKIPKEEV